MKRVIAGAIFAMAGATGLLAACGEKPQTAGHKPDLEPWRGASTAYTAPGWKAGSKTPSPSLASLTPLRL